MKTIATQTEERMYISDYSDCSKQTLITMNAVGKQQEIMMDYLEKIMMFVNDNHEINNMI